MGLLKCKNCGKFIGEKDLSIKNVEQKRIHDWDGIPLEDVITHKNCESAGGKKVNTGDSNCTIFDVVLPGISGLTLRQPYC